MYKKEKFKPVITRVKLNPEQAVLQCPCWDVSRILTTAVYATHTNPTAAMCFEYKNQQTPMHSANNCGATGPYSIHHYTSSGVTS
jgi:hypothetical protein